MGKFKSEKNQQHSCAVTDKGLYQDVHKECGEIGIENVKKLEWYIHLFMIWDKYVQSTQIG